MNFLSSTTLKSYVQLSICFALNHSARMAGALPETRTVYGRRCSAQQWPDITSYFVLIVAAVILSPHPSGA